MNGPYNYVGDGDTEKWIATLEAARKLGARIICPGHGPRGVETVLADQQKFFRSLRDQVGALVKAKKSAQEVRDSIERINATLAGDAQIARYVGKGGGAVCERFSPVVNRRNFRGASIVV